jgi:surface protein
MSLNITYDINSTTCPTKQILFEITGNGNIDWNDGNIEPFNRLSPLPPVSHTYASDNIYNVSISGNLYTYSQQSDTNLGPNAITTITSFNPNLISLQSGFKGCSNLTSAPNSIPTTLTNIYFIFSECSNLNDANIISWNTINITNMDGAFSSTPFNQNISSWNVSNVTSMVSMFQSNNAFDQPIGTWNVSNVTTFQQMFLLSNFNQSINNWNISNCTNLSRMFEICTTFNQDLNNWNTANVTTLENTFLNSTNFDGNVTTWNVANVTTLQSTFTGCSVFNQDLSSWNISNVTNMDNMLSSSNLSITNLDNILNEWGNLSVQPNINFGTSGLEYSNVGLSGYNILTSAPNNWIINATNSSIPCFTKGTKILCVNEHDQDILINVEDLWMKQYRIKTYQSGNLPISKLGIIDNQYCIDLYRFSKTDFSELQDDLIITYNHGILKNYLIDYEKVYNFYQHNIFMTENHYRIPAYLIPNAKKITYESNEYPELYHFSLIGSINYGIYANGMLVETCFDQDFEIGNFKKIY